MFLQQPKAASTIHGDVDPAMLKISREEYSRLTDMIVLHVRREEERHADEAGWMGVRRKELIDWLIFQFKLILKII